MSGSSARSLFAAAREDGPGSEDRDALFRKIAVATGTASAAVVATASSAPTASAAATKAGVATKVATSGGAGMKLLAVGGLIGAAAMGLGVIVASSVGGGTGRRADFAPHPREEVLLPSPGAPLARAAPRGLDPRAPGVQAAVASASVASASSSRPADVGAGSADAVAPRAATAAPKPESALGAPSAANALAEEARLVTEARRSLVGGDAARALALVRATKKLRARAMEPEELGLEARALHALGRADEAAALELELRRRFPDHALAR